MKNLSLALMVFTTLSINLAPAQAVNKQMKISAKNELHSQENTIVNSTNSEYRAKRYCYLIPFGIILCK